jgi:hypothetical protein
MAIRPSVARSSRKAIGSTLANRKPAHCDSLGRKAPSVSTTAGGRIRALPGLVFSIIQAATTAMPATPAPANHRRWRGRRLVSEDLVEVLIGQGT